MLTSPRVIDALLLDYDGLLADPGGAEIRAGAAVCPGYGPPVELGVLV